MEDYIKELILWALKTHPYLLALAGMIGSLRLIIKPLFDVLWVVVKATPTIVDDNALRAIDASQFKRTLIWCLDYLASLPLPKH